MKPLLTPSIKNLSRVVMPLTLLLIAGSFHFSAAQQKAEEKREMLSKHETVAQFVGVSIYTCMGRTALCPDKCRHSGDMANFRIIKYLAYEKPGQYGDEKQKQYQFLVLDNMKNLKVSADVKEATDSLHPDDFLLLSWQHDNVSKDGANYPEHTVTQLKRITKEEAEKLAGRS